jgi:tetratricopeptide (TPR) repeat protein
MCKQVCDPGRNYILTELYRRQDKSELAIELLKTEQERFTQAKSRYLWTELMMELLAKKDASVAIKLVEDYQSEDSILKNRLRAVLYDRLADYSNLEQVGVQLWQKSQEPLDLLNLCGFYRKTEQWAKLEPLAKQMVELSPDPVSVSTIAHALYHNGKFFECLSELEKYATTIFDGKFPDELRRIEIECLFRLNRLDKAVRHLETMLEEHPSSGVVYNLAQAYFRLGRRERAIAVLKEASKAPWADSTIRIEATQLLVNEDPAEAFRLAESVKEDSPSDQRAWLNYIETGFMTGHDREASETLSIFQKRFPESSLLQRFSFNDLLERRRKWQEAQTKHWELYRTAQVPVHVLMDAEAQPLGVEWSMRFRANRSVNSWGQKYPVFVKHGGRYASRSDVEVEGVIADYTALLIGHELDLIPIIEKTFSRIVIPPSLLVVLQADVHKARQFQPSKLQSLQHVKVTLDAGKIGVSPDLISDDLLSPFQVEEVGISGARLFYLAEESGGMVLAKHLGKNPDPDNLLDDKLTTKRVFPREVLTALWRLGAVPQAELQTLVETHLDESCRDSMVDILLKRPSLVTDHLTLEHLAILGVLDRVAGMFNISVPKSDAEYFRESLRAHDLRQSVAERLDELRRYVSERLGKNYHFPSFSMDIDEKDSKGPNVLLLEETCRIAQVEKLPVWIDDRFIHQFERLEQSPILSTMDLLALLKQRRAVSDQEYFQYVNRLLELNPQFYSLDGEAVQYFLRNGQRSDNGSVQESYELKLIRRYFAGNFLQDTALCRSSPDARKLPELALYYQDYQASCRALLADIWCSEAVVEDKEAFSRWIVGRLWKGIEEIRHLLPKPPSLLDSVAVSEFTLLGIAFEILLREMPKTELSSLYLHWLY